MPTSGMVLISGFNKYIVTKRYFVAGSKNDSATIIQEYNKEGPTNSGVFWQHGYVIRQWNREPEYLDINKHPLNKSIIVWQTK